MAQPILNKKKRDFKPAPLEGLTPIPGDLNEAGPLGGLVAILGVDEVPPPPPIRGPSFRDKEARKLQSAIRAARQGVKRYSTTWDRLANGLALSGFTLEEMAAIWGLAPATLVRWQEEQPTFAQALEAGWVGASTSVVRALFKRATGYTIQRRKVSTRYSETHGAETLEEVITEEIPPDVGAITRWLKCRVPAKWGQAAEEPQEQGKGLPAAIRLELAVVPADETDYLKNRTLAQE